MIRVLAAAVKNIRSAAESKLRRQFTTGNREQGYRRQVTRNGTKLTKGKSTGIEVASY